jgi:hypothetical protein
VAAHGWGCRLKPVLGPMSHSLSTMLRRSHMPAALALKSLRNPACQVGTSYPLSSRLNVLRPWKGNLYYHLE